MAAAERLSRSRQLMGTVFTITVYDSDVSPTALDDAFRSLNRVEADFSTYLEDSQISRIGRGILAPDDATPDVRHVLSRCAELEEATGSRFSIRPGRPGGPGLDPAGFVKGWSVDEAALGLRVLGLGRFTIDAGGDVLCAGMAPGGRRWRIGIRHPDAPDDLGVVLMIRDGAVATSGTYFRGDHIWGRRPTDRDVTSVTVVGPSLGVADALATAIYGDQAGELSWLSRFPEYGVLLMTADLQARWTDRLDGVVAPAKSADALSEGETHAPARVSERL